MIDYVNRRTRPSSTKCTKTITRCSPTLPKPIFTTIALPLSPTVRPFFSQQQGSSSLAIAFSFRNYKHPARVNVNESQLHPPSFHEYILPGTSSLLLAWFALSCPTTLKPNNFIVHYSPLPECLSCTSIGSSVMIIDPSVFILLPLVSLLAYSCYFVVTVSRGSHSFISL